MIKFILGVVFALAVIYPTATKLILNQSVDVVHAVTTSAVAEAAKAAGTPK